MDIKRYNIANKLPESRINDIIDFIYIHLEQFGDPKEEIKKAIEYTFSVESGKGGFLLVGYEQNEIIGAVVMNSTGMQGYIPENILVYIVIHKTHRGNGYGELLMKEAIEEANGNIALHVEHDNPALHLYNKLGFSNKYLEMRLEK